MEFLIASIAANSPDAQERMANFLAGKAKKLSE